MGLDVGVITIGYLERPGQPVYGFLQDLMLDPYVGVGTDAEDDEPWGSGWEGNGLYEFSREGLLRRSDDWANSQGLSSEGAAELRQWIRALPWEGEHIMLHMGN